MKPFSILLALLVVMAPLHAQESILRQIDQGFVQLFEKVSPSVVIVEVTKDAEEEDPEEALEFFFKNQPDPGQRFRMPQVPAKSEGSGFIIRREGYILTNHHVVADARKVRVKFKDGHTVPAKVVGSDDKTDIAVLKLEGKPDGIAFSVAELGDSDAIKVGQLVCAIGVPYNLEYSFTCGWVSAKGRSNLTNTTYEDYIQTDAFINPGNSGGPLLDVNGRVIGMNTLINGIGRGLAFAIPSNMLREVGDQLIASGKITRPYLGIRIETLGESSTLKEHLRGVEKGVVVSTIEPDAPAFKSDLRPADVITKVDGVEVLSARDLQKQILKKKIGQTVTLSVWRNGKSMEIPVATGKMPGEEARTASAAPATEGKPGDAAPSAGGLQLQDVNKELAAQLGLKAATGALVTDVQTGSPAAEADIQRGDVITEVNQKPVANAEECRKAIKQGKDALLFIERKGRKTYTVLKGR